VIFDSKRYGFLIVVSKKKKKSKQRQRYSKERSRQDNKKLSISEAVFRITNSFLQKNLPPEEKLPPVEKIIPIAIIGWNYFLFPESSQSNLYETIENTLPPDIDALGFASIIELIEKMADEKRSLYPDVNRMIQGYKFRTNTLGEKVLDVTSVSIQK
jgi:hypothetical protein